MDINYDNVDPFLPSHTHQAILILQLDVRVLVWTHVHKEMDFV